MDYFIYYGLTLTALAVTVLAQLFITSTYKKYSEVDNNKNITGCDAAREILDRNGLQNVKVVEVGGYLSDHYDPGRKTVRLSKAVFEG